MTQRIGIQKRWIHALLSGEKKVEGKKASPRWLSLKEGDRIIFYVDDTPNCDLECPALVVGIRRYPCLRTYLEAEGLRATLPGVQTIEEAIALYRQFWTQLEIDEFGVLAIAVIAEDV